MKSISVLILSSLLLANCGGGGTSDTPPRAAVRPNTELEERKITCVANGGFLVPRGSDFACQLSTGQVVGLYDF